VTVGWLDCSAGVSGNMLLGAIDELGGLDTLPDALQRIPGLGATLERTQVRRAGIAATHVEVRCPDDPVHRQLADVLGLVDAAAVPAPVRQQARAVFERLATAEAAVHGIGRDEVEFHEVGAVDAIVDVVGVCLGLHRLGLDRLTAGPLALGGGTTRSMHGNLPVPAPAVVRLLADTTLVAHGGPVDVELATPTGVALLAELAEPAADLPPMQVQRVGHGAGSREIAEHPNVLRLVVGAAPPPSAAARWVLVEANVDDLDPRLWPAVIDALLGAGAADAWLTPILMKKGRPAHTISVLTDAGRQASVLDVLFRESSTIGARSRPVDKHALDRSWIDVTVGGRPVRVKIGWLDGSAVSVTPEWEDVAVAAKELGLPAKVVLADAVAAARDHQPAADG
jgi:uncharacterized protein (TIGR00299 family) protein